MLKCLRNALRNLFNGVFYCGSAVSVAAVPEVSLRELYHELPNFSLQGKRHFSSCCGLAGGPAFRLRA